MSDMTSAVAIETLRANYPDACYEQLREAVDTAIEALKAQDAAGDTISRKAAIDALAKNMPSLTTPDGCGEFDHDIQVTDEAYVDCMQIIHELPSAQSEKRTEERTETHACDCISRQAVEHLDWFTKLYCRDKSITDDLAFRCKQCEFAMPDGICLVKAMAKKLCPDYKDFGAMGDL